MGFGCVLRDEHGSFMAAKGIPWNGVYESSVAEAMAVREALSWVKGKGIDYVQVETDALKVVLAFQKQASYSSFDLLLNDVKELMSCFTHIEFSFAKRSANRAGHLLARESVSLSDCEEWSSSPPLCIFTVLVLDLH
ncbi:hypothetical protein OROHE_027083 [Orobanche hederae]